MKSTALAGGRAARSRIAQAFRAGHAVVNRSALSYLMLTCDGFVRSRAARWCASQRLPDSCADGNRSSLAGNGHQSDGRIGDALTMPSDALGCRVPCGVGGGGRAARNGRWE